MKYTHEQEMFLLSVASNVGANCHRPLGEIDQLPADVGEKIQSWFKSWALDEDWVVNWIGATAVPTAKDNPDMLYPTNVMFLAYNRVKLTYYISVAGTNANSLFDVGEDFRMHEKIRWPYAPLPLNPAPKISFGFNEGRKILLEMSSDGDTLDKYLGKHVNSDVKIIAGGHSQGGALSPLVALWLLDTQDAWDPSHTVNPKNISCFRTAGPTPGDMAFASYYDSRVPHTVSLVNPLDPVTLFFNAADMDIMPDLYKPQINPGPEITALIAGLRKLAGNGYTQVGQDKIIRLNASVDTCRIGRYKSDCENYTRQMGYHHTTAYFILTGLEPPDEIVEDQFVGLCLCSSNSEEVSDARRVRDRR